MSQIQFYVRVIKTGIERPPDRLGFQKKNSIAITIGEKFKCKMFPKKPAYP